MGPTLSKNGAYRDPTSSINTLHLIEIKEDAYSWCDAKSPIKDLESSNKGPTIWMNLGVGEIYKIKGINLKYGEGTPTPKSNITFV